MSPYSVWLIWLHWPWLEWLYKKERKDVDKPTV